jgi:hypothetical protein
LSPEPRARKPRAEKPHAPARTKIARPHRNPLDAYGLVRLTAKADEYLERALDLAGSA